MRNFEKRPSLNTIRKVDWESRNVQWPGYSHSTDDFDGREGVKKEKKGKGSYALVIWDMFVSVRVTVMV